MKLRFLTFFALLSPAYSQTDPAADSAAIVRQSIENYQRTWREAADWRYEQKDVTESDGMKEVAISEIAPLDGTPYERLIGKDGQNLPPEEQRREDRKYRKAEHERAGETPQERQARIEKYENNRAFVKDIPDAYTFTLLGDQEVNGRPAWVIRMTPRPGFVPTEPHASMLSHIEGKLWIDKEDVEWAKAEANVIDTISIGWILARIGAGAHITVDQTRVAPGLWMPQRLTISGTARVFLVHNKPLNEELTYSGYRRDPVNSARIPRTPVTRPTQVRPTQNAPQSFR